VNPAADGVTVNAHSTALGIPDYPLRLVGGAGHRGRTGSRQRLYRLALSRRVLCGLRCLRGARLTTLHIARREQIRPAARHVPVTARNIADVYIVARTLHLATLSVPSAAGGWVITLALIATWPPLDVPPMAPEVLRSATTARRYGIGMTSYPMPHLFSALIKGTWSGTPAVKPLPPGPARRPCVSIFHRSQRTAQYALRDRAARYFANVPAVASRSRAILTDGSASSTADVVPAIVREAGWAGLAAEDGGRGLARS